MCSRLAREQWHTLILDAHPGYISWQEYEENLRRLSENAQTRGVAHRRCPPREGPALLQGLVVCGRCGGRMTVSYHYRKDRLAPYYWCAGRKEADQVLHGECQRIGGSNIDQAIGDLLVEVVNPLALDVTLAVQCELEARWEETDRLRRTQVERARYEAELARRRFLRVDPDNRLVGASLESDWNEKLRALAEAEQHYERQRQRDDQSLDSSQRKQVRSRALASSPSATPKVAMNESMSVVRTRVGAHFLSLDVATSRTKDRIAGSSVPACATADSISGHHNFSSTDRGFGESDGLLVGCSGRAFLRAVLTCAYVAVTKQRRKGT